MSVQFSSWLMSVTVISLSDKVCASACVYFRLSLTKAPLSAVCVHINVYPCEDKFQL